MEMELLQDNYKSPLPKQLRWSNWATDEEGITATRCWTSSTTRCY